MTLGNIRISSRGDTWWGDQLRVFGKLNALLYSVHTRTSRVTTGWTMKPTGLLT